MTRGMDKASTAGQEAAITRELLLTTSDTVLEKCTGKKGRTTRDNGSKVLSMERVRFMKTTN